MDVSAKRGLTFGSTFVILDGGDNTTKYLKFQWLQMVNSYGIAN